MGPLSVVYLGTATFGQHASVQQTYRSLFSQVCNGALSAFERLPRTGRRWDLTSLLSVAERQTGLNDFGDDRFLEPMAFLLESIEREAKLNALGRFVFYQHTIQLLRNRLYLERDSRIDRRISRRKIPKPVFITGLPRTDTTLLHSLLAQEQELFAAPLTWEVIYPSPAQGETRRRMERTERDLKWFDRLVPAFRPIHPLSAELSAGMRGDYESLLHESRVRHDVRPTGVRVMVGRTRSAPGLCISQAISSALTPWIPRAPVRPQSSRSSSFT